MPKETWTALCGDGVDQPTTKPPFQPNLTRRLYPPVNPTRPRPVVPAAATTGAAAATTAATTGAAAAPGGGQPIAPQPNAASTSGIRGRMKFNTLFQDLRNRVKYGKLDTVTFDGGPFKLPRVMTLRVNNDVLSNGQKGFYLIDPATESVMEIIEAERDGKYNIRYETVKTDKGVDRGRIRLDGFAYECNHNNLFDLNIMRTLGIHDMVRPFAQEGDPSIWRLPPGVHIHKCNYPTTEMIAALTESYGIKGFYLLASSPNNEQHTLHKQLPEPANEQDKYHVIIPIPKMLDSYLEKSIRTTTVGTVRFELLADGKDKDGKERLIDNDKVLFGQETTDPQSTTKCRNPGERYPL
jgi:hypothetical protein